MTDDQSQIDRVETHIRLRLSAQARQVLPS